MHKTLQLSANKATGLDGWSAKELMMAPDKWFDLLAEMLIDIEEGRAAWPAELRQ